MKKRLRREFKELRWEHVIRRLGEVEGRVKALEGELGVIKSWQMDIGPEITRMEERLRRLEEWKV